MKKVSLAAALSPKKPVEIAPPVVASPQPAMSVRAPSRIGKSAVTFYMDPAQARRLKAIAAERGTSIQALMTQAHALLLQELGERA